VTDPPQLDLHGVRARDARAHVVRFVQAVRLATPGSTVRIVTGLGLHSTASPVLHKLVRQMLESKTVPHVAAWRSGPDGGSFVVTLTGPSGSPPGRAAEPPSRRAPTAREQQNARQLEYARRVAERALAAEAEAAAEARRLAALRAEYGGRELPDWLCLPPATVVEARAERARAEEADRIAYGTTRPGADGSEGRGPDAG
jgi:hypothetical protein